jgi:phosphopantothenoylcysteine decarboxylase/phosphopantothenate--cysteine ligase
MESATVAAFANADIAILSAAVADYAPAEYAPKKIKRETDDVPTIKLVKNPDIAAGLGRIKHNGQILVGFALETDNVELNAKDKLARKNLDLIVLNSLQDKGAGFGTDTNKITIYAADGDKRCFQLKSKAAVAADILDTITEKYL